MSGPHEILARASAWLWPAAADHLWQSALFAALVFALALLLRRGPARTRHALWLVALLKFAAPPALFALLAAGAGLDASPFLAQTRGAETTAAPLALQLAGPAAALSGALEKTAVGASAGAESHAEIYCALTLAWLAGCAALLLVRARRRREFMSALGAGRETYAGREFEAMERARGRLGLGRDARLLLSPRGTFPFGPGVWRTRAPVVVLPATLAAQLDEEELESLMLHELAHVERRDNLVGCVQAALTCVFWFCPPVWAVGRKVVEERERACDERVLGAGVASASYASSILKVVRFCSGWNVAGVAGAAAGPNLRRRIEEIMRGKTGHGQTAWARALPPAAAIVALALSACAGVYSYAQQGGGNNRGGLAVVARETRSGGGQGGARGRGAEQRGASGAAAAEIEQAPESPVFFDNPGDAPLVVTDAKMRVVTREQLGRADEEGADSSGDLTKSEFFLTMPSVTVANFTVKTVREVGIGFVTSGRTSVIAGYAASIKPGESQTFRSEWERRNVILPGTPADVTVRVVWVEFTDGSQWGGRPRAPLPPGPPPPPPPPPDRKINRGEGVGVGEGVGGGVSGSVSSSVGGSGVGGVAGGTGVGGSVGGGSGVGGGVGVGGGAGGGAAVGEGRAEGGGTARGGGVGAGAGAVNGGILNQRVRTAPNPAYPAIAKAANAQGTVAVRILIDEEGNVVSAEAVSGHPLLLGAAVEAARNARFAPTRLGGRPVKVSGHLTYNFVLDKKQERQQQQ